MSDINLNEILVQRMIENSFKEKAAILYSSSILSLIPESVKSNLDSSRLIMRLEALGKSLIQMAEQLKMDNDDYSSEDEDNDDGGVFV